MHRLFVAIRPPRPIRTRLIAAMGGVPHARWQTDDQLHLTLRFIGEVDRHQAEDVAAALGAVHHPRFPIALSGMGQFDRHGRVDSLWAGVTPADGPASLHRKVDQALVRIGLPPEGRAYLPHITIARFGRLAGPVDAAVAAGGSLSSDPVVIEEFQLYESELGHDGAVYTIAARYPLG